ncbi:MAG: hypothetical protein FJX47_15295, partial [Alphaproteobacteria bacterium]|nr:hypothetical protein [Alphaproteobacteria bacterium]
PNPVVWFALAGIGALAAFAAFKPAPPAPMPDLSRIAALETRIEKMPAGVDPALVARLDRIAASLAALEARLTAAEQSGLPAELKRLADRQRALERSFADLPSPDTEATRRLTEFQSALDTALKRADERLAALEVRLGRALERPAALALAVGQLRAALQGAGSFAGEVERLATLAEGDGSISGPIRELLDLKAGVPGLAELRGRFGAVAREALRPERDAGAPIWERAWTRFTDLVSVRRVGEVVGESAEALIARAEARLAAGDLAAAVAEVERLSGAAKTSTNAWLTEAKRRLAAEAAMAALDRAIMDRMREAKK